MEQGTYVVAIEGRPMNADTRETSSLSIHDARTLILLADSICAGSLMPLACSAENCTGL